MTGRRRAERVGGVVQSIRYSPAMIMLAIVAGLDVLLIIVGFALQHYFNIDVISSLTDIPNDGGYTQNPHYACVPARIGLGDHCFGDYTEMALLSSFGNPWQQVVRGLVSNYPAAGMLPFLIFGAIGRLFGDARVGLFLFLIVMAVGITLPAIWAARGRSLPSRIAIAGVLGIVSVPALMALDRGNAVGLVVPVLWLLFIAIGRDRRWLLVSMIVAATLVKPQYAVLVIVPLLRGRWRDTLGAVGGAAVVNLLAFLIWPKDFPATIMTALHNILQYGSSNSLASQYPINISFARALYAVEVVLYQILGVRVPRVTVVDQIQSAIGPVILLLVIAALVILRKRIPTVVAAMLLIVCASLLTSVSYSYYLVYAIPFAAVILRHPGSGPREFGRGLFDTSRPMPMVTAAANMAIAVATALTITRVPIPGTHVASASLVATDADLIPLAWLAAMVLVVIAGFQDRRWREDLESRTPTRARSARRSRVAAAYENTLAASVPAPGGQQPLVPPAPTVG